MGRRPSGEGVGAGVDVDERLDTLGRAIELVHETEATGQGG